MKYKRNRDAAFAHTQITHLSNYRSYIVNYFKVSAIFSFDSHFFPIVSLFFHTFSCIWRISFPHFFYFSLCIYMCMVYVRVYTYVCVCRAYKLSFSLLSLRVNAQIEHSKISITIQSKLGKKSSSSSRNGSDEADSLSFSQRVSWSWSFNVCNELAFHSVEQQTVVSIFLCFVFFSYNSYCDGSFHFSIDQELFIGPEKSLSLKDVLICFDRHFFCMMN